MSTTREKMIERAVDQLHPHTWQRNLWTDQRCREIAAAVIDAIGAVKMAEALEPFAKFADVLDVYNDSLTIDHSRDRKITLGDLRRARAILAKATGGEHE